MKMSFRSYRVSGWTAVILLSAFGASFAEADVSFKGKTIEFIVTSDPAGGTGRTGRLTSEYMKKYLPGDPEVITKFTGGRRIQAMNVLANQTEPDGLTVYVTSSVPLQPGNVRRKVARYDPRTFEPIGGINRGGSLIFVRKQAHPQLKDKSAEPVVVAAVSGTRSWQAMTMWGAKFLGWNLRWIPGYKSSSSMAKALRQGEIDMFGTSNAFHINELVKDGVIDLLVQPGLPAEKGYERRSSFKNVPVFPELLKEANPPKVAWQGYLSMIGPSQVDKWLTLPPKTPREIVEAHRKAFAKAFNDPGFQKKAKKQLSVDIFMLSGEKVREMINEILSLPDEAIEYGVNLRKHYGLAAR